MEQDPCYKIDEQFLSCWRSSTEAVIKSFEIIAFSEDVTTASENQPKAYNLLTDVLSLYACLNKLKAARSNPTRE